MVKGRFLFVYFYFIFPLKTIPEHNNKVTKIDLIQLFIW